MKIKLFVTLLFIISCFIGCGTDTNNSEESVQSENSVNQNDGKDDEIQEEPKVLMDLFSGERRIWFYINGDRYDTDLTYDDRVAAVFVVENREVTHVYYSMVEHSAMLNYMDSPEINPCSTERYALADFDGMSDDEIISKISSTYADASIGYTFPIGEAMLDKSDFPYKIQYKGDLDSSGNKLKYECLKFFDVYYLRIDETSTVLGSRISSRIQYDEMIEPTVIKNKEYIGIFDDSQNVMLITLNNYPEFDNLELDDPNGMSDF